MSDRINYDDVDQCFTATYVDKVQTTKEKVVFGLDFGTTYMGISKVYTDDPSTVFCGAPSCNTNLKDQVKVPTVVLKTPSRWYFGSEALSRYNTEIAECDDTTTETSSGPASEAQLASKGIYLFKHFKMKLKDKTAGMETLEVKAQNSTYKHSLMDLITRCLKYLSQYAMDLLNSGYYNRTNISKDGDEIRWVLTVPAIWNDFSKAFMRREAYRAGLIDREQSTNLLLTLEPESAALAVHGDAASYGFLKQDESFLVVDCGGGTVDTTPMVVSATNPLVLDALSPPTGGAWGSIFVEYRFREFLERLFGKETFRKLKNRCPGEFAEIMEDFRSLKEEFDPRTDTACRISLRSILHQETIREFGIRPLQELVEAYHNQEPQSKLHFDMSSRESQRKLSRESILTFTKEQMLRFFEYSHSRICDCIRETLKKHPSIRQLILVGGGAASRALQDRIRSEFENKETTDVRVIVPDRTLIPQAAVVQGAAYYGLYTSVIGKRYPKLTYGYRTNKRWLWRKRDGFKRRDSTYDPILKERRIRNVFQPIVKKGSAVLPSQTFFSKDRRPLHPKQKVVSIKLFASTKTDPKWTTGTDCRQLGTITVPCTGNKKQDRFDVEFTFGAEIQVQVIRSDGRRESTTIQFE